MCNCLLQTMKKKYYNVAEKHKKIIQFQLVMLTRPYSKQVRSKEKWNDVILLKSYWLNHMESVT